MKVTVLVCIDFLYELSHALLICFLAKQREQVENLRPVRQQPSTHSR